MTVLLIDGRSGSGKTELAAAIVATWDLAQVVHMDDLYPGWDGLERGSALVPEALRRGHFEPWDWHAGRRSGHRVLDLSRPVVVEGVGALSAASRELADFAIWVETDDATRRARALARDGEAFAPHWDRWAAQERSFFDREQSPALADAVVFGHNVGTDAARWRRIVEAAAAAPSA
jgi:dephospho-CoA kinase